MGDADYKMKKIVTYLNLIIVIGIMGSIFFMSSQTGKESSELSHGVILRLRENIESTTWIGSNLKAFFASNAVVLTRKMAHIIIYLLLGMGGYRLLPQKWSVKKRIFVGISLCCVYGVSDEFHQMFVPNRSAQIVDVIIDTIGSGIGVGIGVVLNKYCKRI